MTEQNKPKVLIMSGKEPDQYARTRAIYDVIKSLEDEGLLEIVYESVKDGICGMDYNLLMCDDNCINSNDVDLFYAVSERVNQIKQHQPTNNTCKHKQPWYNKNRW